MRLTREAIESTHMATNTQQVVRENLTIKFSPEYPMEDGRSNRPIRRSRKSISGHLPLK